MSALARLAFAPLALASGLLAAPAAAGAQAAATDSLLASACAGGAGMADGLLLVEFRADVDAARRESMAKEAGGALAGDTGFNEAYVILPPGSRTDLAADRLIRLDGVQSVGDVACPAPAAPAPAATAARPDSTRADSSRADTTARPDSAGRAPADTTQQTAPADTLPGATPTGTPGGAAPPADTTTPLTPADSVAAGPGPA